MLLVHFRKYCFSLVVSLFVVSVVVAVRSMWWTDIIEFERDSTGAAGSETVVLASGKCGILVLRYSQRAVHRFARREVHWSVSRPAAYAGGLLEDGACSRLGFCRVSGGDPQRGVEAVMFPFWPTCVLAGAWPGVSLWRRRRRTVPSGC